MILSSRRKAADPHLAVPVDPGTGLHRSFAPKRDERTKPQRLDSLRPKETMTGDPMGS